MGSPAQIDEDVVLPDIDPVPEDPLNTNMSAVNINHFISMVETLEAVQINSEVSESDQKLLSDILLLATTIVALGQRQFDEDDQRAIVRYKEAISTAIDLRDREEEEAARHDVMEDDNSEDDDEDE